MANVMQFDAGRRPVRGRLAKNGDRPGAVEPPCGRPRTERAAGYGPAEVVVLPCVRHEALDASGGPHDRRGA